MLTFQGLELQCHVVTPEEQQMVLNTHLSLKEVKEKHALAITKNLCRVKYSNIWHDYSSHNSDPHNIPPSIPDISTHHLTLGMSASNDYQNGHARWR